MNRIDAAFTQLKQKGEKALVGFVSAGDPSLSRSMEIIQSMVEAGLDVLELGVPFSDPTADGPVIQRSSLRALKAGMELAKVLEMTRELRKTTQIPIVIFSYYNPILAYGVGRFYRDAVTSGADGLLVVDLPPEESDEMTYKWSGNSLALIRLVAPTTPPDRMAAIARKASGFIYLVSMTGVTGSGGLDTEEVTRVTKELKAVTPLPICIGFGISTPDQVKEMGSFADGIVVGSAFERIIEAHLDDPQCPSKVGESVRALKAATLPR